MQLNLSETKVEINGALASRIYRGRKTAYLKPIYSFDSFDMNFVCSKRLKLTILSTLKK